MGEFALNFRLVSFDHALDDSPKEAVTAVRKRLKHGSTKQKRMALAILKVLVENAGSRFHNELVGSEKMHDRLENIITSPVEDSQVKHQLVELLGIWSKKYKGQPGMGSIDQLYSAGVGRMNVRYIYIYIYHGFVSHTGLTQQKMPRTQKRQSIQPPRPSTPPHPPAANRLDTQSSSSGGSSKRRSLPPPTKSSMTKPRSNSGAANILLSSRKFDFKKEKSKIVEEVALAQQNAYNLTNAIKFVNVEEEGPRAVKFDAKVQEYAPKCEESRKKIVQYARLVEDEEWIGK
ncbi:VHS domain-containing protein [Jimgerdemannia flammicorona]|uniref:VHS domain-containing protein n=1 Tax=Jimgerdemannia flammicorona TaxID=994334 RepID=A0A433QPX7_9FUNG|nr:VHS domain-containing protein [Jimgerdemannia flammicorona]